MDGNTAAGLAFLLGFSIFFVCMGSFRAFAVKKDDFPTFESAKCLLAGVTCLWCCVGSIIFTAVVLESQREKEESWRQPENTTDRNPYSDDRRDTQRYGLMGNAIGLAVGFLIFCSCCRGERFEKWLIRMGYYHTGDPRLSTPPRRQENAPAGETIVVVPPSYPGPAPATHGDADAPPSYAVAAERPPRPPALQLLLEPSAAAVEPLNPIYSDEPVPYEVATAPAGGAALSVELPPINPIYSDEPLPYDVATSPEVEAAHRFTEPPPITPIYSDEPLPYQEDNSPNHSVLKAPTQLGHGTTVIPSPAAGAPPPPPLHAASPAARPVLITRGGSTTSADGANVSSAVKPAVSEI